MHPLYDMARYKYQTCNLSLSVLCSLCFTSEVLRYSWVFGNSKLLPSYSAKYLRTRCLYNSPAVQKGWETTGGYCYYLILSPSSYLLSGRIKHFYTCPVYNILHTQINNKSNSRNIHLSAQQPHSGMNDRQTDR